MCFLFLGDEFSAAALLYEEPRIKTIYTDAQNLKRAKNKYTPFVYTKSLRIGSVMCIIF